MGKFPPRADGSKGDPFHGRKRGDGMEGNDSSMAVHWRHDYFRRSTVNKKRAVTAATITTHNKNNSRRL